MNYQSHPLDVQPWPWWRKVIFRFLFVFIALYFFPFPIDYNGFLGFMSPITEWYNDQAEAFALWNAKWLFGQEELNTQTTGSGDTLYNYLYWAVLLCYSAVGAMIWSLADRKAMHYDRLKTLLLIAVRYWYGIVIIGYGFAKVFHLQFSPFWAYRLPETVGDLSPMGLVWLFMSYSEPYNWFTGGAEVLGGFLLFFRRTTRVGALLLIAVMANVVAINYFFDVPVKLNSSLYLIFSIVLAWPALKGMWSWLVLQRTVAPVPLKPLYTRKPWTYIGWTVKGLILITWMYTSFTEWSDRVNEYGKGAPSTKLEGLWEVQEFVVNGDTLPKLWTDDSVYWRYWTPFRQTRAFMQYNDRSRKYYTYEFDSLNDNQFTLVRDSVDTYTFTYTLEQDSLLYFHGFYQGDTLDIHLSHTWTEDYLITNRPFNWINERPFNR